MTMADIKKNYNISFYCKPIKKYDAQQAFESAVASLGETFSLSYNEKTPIITTMVIGVHEIHGILTRIESVCNIVVEQLGYDQGLL